MVVAGFVAPYLLDTTTRFVQAAASLPDALGALLGRSAAGILENVGQTLTGVRALWPGEARF